MRYFLELSYDGLPFHGWQRQPNACSVQETLEQALATMLQYPVDVTGAGRTDAGVHARQMYAHFETQGPIRNEEVFLRSLNRLIGKGIAVKWIFQVENELHARFDAKERTYKYFVIYEKCPFLRDYTWLSPTRLNVEKMNEAATHLLGRQDFTSFSKLHTDVKTNICDVRKAYWEEYQNDLGIPGIVFTISADRFLRNMVRAIVGTLVEVGRGKMDIEGFKNVILQKDRCSAGTSMPGEGLFLWEIRYDNL